MQSVLKDFDRCERLLSDLIPGNQTLFVRETESMTASAWLDPILQHQEASEQRPEKYTSGIRGAAADTLLLAKDGGLRDGPDLDFEK